MSCTKCGESGTIEVPHGDRDCDECGGPDPMAYAIQALEDCLEDLQFWSEYAPEYFQRKHKLQESLEEHQWSLTNLKKWREKNATH